MRKQIAPAVRTSGSTRRGRRFATVLTAVVAGAVLAACSSSSGDGSSTAPGTASTANASLTADLAAATAKKDVKVDLPALTKLPAVKGRTVLVVAISAVPFAGVISDLKAALQVVGASAHVCDGQAQAATISSCLAQAGTLNAVAVITLAIPYELAPTAFNAVAQQKIPVLAAFQDPLKKKSSATLTYQPSSPTLTAAFNASADYAIVHSNFKGNILVLIINDSPAAPASR